MSYFDLSSHDDDVTPKATAVHDRHRPGVRLTVGPLYLSMTVSECVDVLDALTEALAELSEGK